MQNTDLFRSGDVVKALIAQSFFEQAKNLSQNELISKLLEVIVNKRGGGQVLVISLIGGAASGKSALTESLVLALCSQNIAADFITTDDYNKGDRVSRRQMYESSVLASNTELLKKFDVEKLNELVTQIKANKDTSQTVAVPTYREEDGLAVDIPEEQWHHRIPVIDVLIIEGDFNIITHSDLVIYVHMDDYERLFWRTRRDSELRNEQNISKIRQSFMVRQELQHFSLTLPVATNADIIVVVDSTCEDWTYAIHERQSAVVS